MQYAALASKVTMTSEVEHDILVGPDGAWRGGHGCGAAAAAVAGGGGAAGGVQESEALAAAEAAAAAARSALSCAQVGCGAACYAVGSGPGGGSACALLAACRTFVCLQPTLCPLPHLTSGHTGQTIRLQWDECAP